MARGRPCCCCTGLFGRATTWEGTAAWLRPHFRVVGLDQRGHGLSDKPDGAYSRDDGTTA